MSRRGVTLVELLVVVAALAVLVGLLLPAIGLVRTRSRTVETGHLLTQLTMAAETYRHGEGRLPTVQSGDPEVDDMVSGTPGDPVGGWTLDLLVRRAGLAIPTGNLIRSATLSRVVDGWRQPVFYQIADPRPLGRAISASMAAAHAFWSARGVATGDRIYPVFYSSAGTPPLERRGGADVGFTRIADPDAALHGQGSR
ncbi:MAG: hypothetical protein RLZZ127_641 [Planctomycetota bacterium]|jgi:prepilin-type N-terminal cleavage/methylation domain-containing protein